MDFDFGLAAQLVTAAVASVFGLVKSIQAVIAFFRRK